MKKIFIMLFCLSFLSGCYYDNEEALYPIKPACDTLNVSYKNTVHPILDNNCISCHNANFSSGNVNLDGHSFLLVHVNSGKFLSSITHDGNASKMPQGRAKLDDCTLDKIKSWINQGAPNN